MGLGLRFLLALIVIAAALTAPVASAGTRGCALAPHGSFSSVGVCQVAAYVEDNLRIRIVAAFGATGLVHVDAGNTAPGGERVEFDCALTGFGTMPAPCAFDAPKFAGVYEGQWIVTATMTNANPFVGDAWGAMYVTSE